MLAQIDLNSQANQRLPEIKEAIQDAAKDLDEDGDDHVAFFDVEDSKTTSEMVSEINKVAFPVFCARISYYGMATTDAILIGHVGADYLAATSLSDFWLMPTQAVLMARVSNSYFNQAYGTGAFELVGVWLQTSQVVLQLINIPMIMWYGSTYGALVLMGYDKETAWNAFYYSMVMGLALPGLAAFRDLCFYFVTMKEASVVSNTQIMTAVLNLVFGFQLVLGVPFSNLPGGYGFWICPIVTVAVRYVIVLYFYLYHMQYRQVHLKCWPTQSVFNPEYFNSIIRPKLSDYLALYMPCVAANFSDNFRMMLIGFMAASLNGSTQSAAVYKTFITLYQLNVTCTSAIVAGMQNQMGYALGAGKAADARKSVEVSFYMAAGLLLMTVIPCVLFFNSVGQVFCSDPAFLEVFNAQGVWWATAMFMCCVRYFFQGVLVALKRNDVTLYGSLISCWLVEIPSIVMLLYGEKIVGSNLLQNEPLGLSNHALATIYFGMTFGSVVCCAVYAYFGVYMVEWEKEALNAHTEIMAQAAALHAGAGDAADHEALEKKGIEKRDEVAKRGLATGVAALEDAMAIDEEDSETRAATSDDPDVDASMNMNRNNASQSMNFFLTKPLLANGSNPTGRDSVGPAGIPSKTNSANSSPKAQHATVAVTPANIAGTGPMMTGAAHASVALSAFSKAKSARRSKMDHAELEAFKLSHQPDGGVGVHGNSEPLLRYRASRPKTQGQGQAGGV